MNSDKFETQNVLALAPKSQIPGFEQSLNEEEAGFASTGAETEKNPKDNECLLKHADKSLTQCKSMPLTVLKQSTRFSLAARLSSCIIKRSLLNSKFSVTPILESMVRLFAMEKQFKIGLNQRRLSSFTRNSQKKQRILSTKIHEEIEIPELFQKESSKSWKAEVLEMMGNVSCNIPTKQETSITLCEVKIQIVLPPPEQKQILEVNETPNIDKYVETMILKEEPRRQRRGCFAWFRRNK